MNKNMDVGIFMRDSNGNKFANVKISDSGSHAVFISQVDELAGTVPKNNTFEKLFVEGGKGNGFHLNSAGNNRLVNPKFNNVRGQDILCPLPEFCRFCTLALNIRTSFDLRRLASQRNKKYGKISLRGNLYLNFEPQALSNINQAIRCNLL